MAHEPGVEVSVGSVGGDIQVTPALRKQPGVRPTSLEDADMGHATPCANDAHNIATGEVIR